MAYGKVRLESHPVAFLEDDSLRAGSSTSLDFQRLNRGIHAVVVRVSLVHSLDGSFVQSHSYNSLDVTGGLTEIYTRSMYGQTLGGERRL